MPARRRVAVMGVVMMFAVGMASGGEINVDSPFAPNNPAWVPGSTASEVTTGSAAVFLYSGTGDPADWSGVAVTIDDGHHLVVGPDNASARAGAGFSLPLDTVRTAGSASRLTLDKAFDGNAISLSLRHLDMSAGGSVSLNKTTSGNALEAGILSASGGAGTATDISFTLNDGASFAVTGFETTRIGTTGRVALSLLGEGFFNLAGGLELGRESSVLGSQNVGMIVEGATTLGGRYETHSGFLETYADVFRGGLTIVEGGRLVSLGGGTVVKVGGDADIVLAGGILDASGLFNSISLALETPGSGRFIVASGGAILGSVAASDMDAEFNGDTLVAGDLAIASLTARKGVTTLGDAAGATGGLLIYSAGRAVFESGSTLRIVGGAGTLSSFFHGLEMRAGTTLDLSEQKLNVSCGGNVELDGRLIVGGTAANPHSLDFIVVGGGAVNLGPNFFIQIGNSLLNDMGAGDQAALLTGNLTSGGGIENWKYAISNLYGDYTATGQNSGIILTADLVRNVASAAAVRERLGGMFGVPVSGGFAAAAAGVIANNRAGNDALRQPGPSAGVFVDASADPAAVASGLTHYNFILAAANHNAAGSGYAAFDVLNAGGERIGGGTADPAMLALYGGYAANTTAQVATDLAIEGTGRLHDRVFGINQAMNALRRAGSDDAHAALVMNAAHLNRFWAGGFGLWADAGSRGGLAGYKYDGHGFMIGYDRALGAFTLGGAFAYARGDYKDKSANANDSTIDSYGVNLYANYNHRSGFFATAMGGYACSGNDIRDSRGGGWVRQDFHTDTWNLGAKLGYGFHVSEAFSVTPSAGLAYVQSENGCHTARWGNVLDFLYGKARLRSALLPVDLRTNYDLMTGPGSKLSLGLTLGYAYNLRRGGPDLAVGYVGLAGPGGALAPEPGLGRYSGRHRFTVGTGLRFSRERFDLGVNYDYCRKAGYDAHRVFGVVGVSF